VSDELLQPLLQGRSVILAIRDPKMPKKKRITQPVVILAPLALLAIGSSGLVAMVPGGGCEILPMDRKVKTIELVRLSLSATMALRLASALNRVFNLGE